MPNAARSSSRSRCTFDSSKPPLLFSRRKIFDWVRSTSLLRLEKTRAAISVHRRCSFRHCKDRSAARLHILFSAAALRVARPLWLLVRSAEAVRVPRSVWRPMPQSTAQGVLVRTVSIICSSCEQNASLYERRRLRVALLRAPQACDTSLIDAGSIFRSRRIFNAIFLNVAALSVFHPAFHFSSRALRFSCPSPSLSLHVSV